MEVIWELLEVFDFEKEVEVFRIEIVEIGFELKMKKVVKWLKLVEVFVCFGNRLEWMIMIVVLVILFEFCLFVFFDGGCFVMLDFNDLYRCVIN